MIVHIAARADWERARSEGSYRLDSLLSDGFIHCSTRAQATRVADALFSGRRDLVLLCIDPARLTSDLRFEAPADSSERDAPGERFPHVYGPIDLDSVIAVLDFPPDEDGRFRMPSEPLI
jgi:uncharacterized protein (DUF952 family)